MRQFFKSSAGFLVLILVGLIVAAAGTATAAKLITSADIKNGTIKGEDIKKGTISEKRLSEGVKAKLNSGGPQGLDSIGPQGPKGDSGAAAPGGFIIRDGDGNVVNGFVAFDLDTFLRESDGVLWEYGWDGNIPTNIVFFTELNCTGTPLIGAPLNGAPLPNPQSGVLASNGQGYRYADTAPQTISFKSRIAKTGGSCDLFPQTGFMQELAPVNAPPALNGPLTVKANP